MKIIGFNITQVIAIFVLFFGTSPKNFGSDNLYALGARPAGMAGAAIAITDLWSVQHNQATLVGLKYPIIGLYNENRFLIKQLVLRSFAMALPFKAGTLGLSYSHFGYKHYYETKTGISLAKTLFQGFSLGVQIDYLHIHQPEGYKSKGAFIFEGGIAYRVSPFMNIGFHIFNPNGNEIYKAEKDISTVFSVGASCQLPEKVLLVFEIEKDISIKPTIQSGIEYKIIEQLLVRLGFSTNPGKPTFGLTYKVKNITVDAAFSRHPTLGVTPHFSMGYAFPKQFR